MGNAKLTTITFPSCPNIYEWQINFSRLSAFKIDPCLGIYDLKYIHSYFM